MYFLTYNKTQEGMFDESVIRAVWEKAIATEGYEESLYRRDAAGAWIAFNKYGDRGSALGWEIDHVLPTSKGGGDNIDNLRPLHWQNNDSKGDDYPVYYTAVLAEGVKNVARVEKRTVNKYLQSKIKHLYGI